MSPNFLKTDSHLLETGLQTPPPNFFRKQFLESITKNPIFIKTQCIQTGLTELILD
jgi:hypothetical protein